MDLRQSGVAVTPVPVKGKDGDLIQIVPHSRLPRPRHVVLYEWETGREPTIQEKNLPELFEILGEVTARMHQHARQWRRPPWFQRHTWDFERTIGFVQPRWGRWRDGIGVGEKKAELFGRTVALIGRRLTAYGKSTDRFGLVHCDLRLANLLVDGKTMKVIDFDDCGFGWYMCDAAAPVSFYEHEPRVPGLIEAWKKGYRRAIPLPKPDEDEIPTFVMMRRLLLVAWIGSHSETDLAKSMGLPYTEGTVGLCEDYLRRFS
jgi:Ser/Thr protein kinase RdoA (MazF antagonist)